MNIEYKISTATQKQIYNLLFACDKYFVPPLSERVCIEEYSKKIFDIAINFEAWSNDNLIGLVSMYLNKNEAFGYITNVSVFDKFIHQGIASNLLKNSIEYAKAKNINKIKLEVNKNNLKALNLYAKFKFKTYKDTETDQFMQLNFYRKAE